MYYKTCKYRNRTVHWFFCSGKSDFLLHTLDRIGADEKIIDRVKSILESEDSGFTYNGKRESVVYISTSTSPKEFFNTYVHELRHLTNFICSEYGIDPESEKASYIEGKLSECNICFVHKVLCGGSCLV